MSRKQSCNECASDLICPKCQSVEAIGAKLEEKKVDVEALLKESNLQLSDIRDIIRCTVLHNGVPSTIDPHLTYFLPVGGNAYAKLLAFVQVKDAESRVRECTHPNAKYVGNTALVWCLDCGSLANEAGDLVRVQVSFASMHESSAWLKPSRR